MLAPVITGDLTVDPVATSDEPTPTPEADEPVRDQNEPTDDITAKQVKKLAKKLVEKQISTRDKVKKLIVGTGNQKISQMDQAARNTVYHSLMNAFTLSKKK